MDRFTFGFGFASYLLRLIPIGFGSAKNDRDTWGRDGHVDFDGGMKTMLSVGNFFKSFMRPLPKPVVGTIFQLKHKRRTLRFTGENLITTHLVRDYET
jgi:hypothetical protein